MKPLDYSWATDDMFNDALRTLLEDEWDLVTTLFHIPQVYEILQEHFNNEVLAKLEVLKQSEQALRGVEDDDDEPS